MYKWWESIQELSYVAYKEVTKSLMWDIHEHLSRWYVSSKDAPPFMPNGVLGLSTWHHDLLLVRPIKYWFILINHVQVNNYTAGESENVYKYTFIDRPNIRYI